MGDPCDRCRAIPGGYLDECRREGDCRRASAEAQAKEDNRTGQIGPKWTERTCFDALCRHQQTLTEVLTWHYPQVSHHGTYRQDIMVLSVHRYEVRRFRLRGEPRPRHRDEVEKSLGATRRVGGIYDLAYRNSPVFAAIRKDAV